MKKQIYILCLALLGVFSACQDLEIAPPSIMTDEAIFNEGGIEAYMAGLYGRLPMEDFNKTDKDGPNDREGFFHWNNIKWGQIGTGETVNRNNTGMVYVDDKYFEEGYKLIRNANHLIKELPAYEGELVKASEWIAEAKFIRAYTYFYMVKLYGGVPIIEEPQGITDDESELWVPRASHQETIDFILEDLDAAIAGMNDNRINGRANKYVAAALKSRVALFAGSIARYGKAFEYEVDGVMLCGLPESSANDYFKMAWDAANIVEEGSYALYQKDGNLAENFAKIYEDADNSDESIFIRQYDFLNYVHSYDCVYSPPRMSTTYGDRFNVTVDWVELFDGLPIDPTTGKLSTTDVNGDYIVYDGMEDFFGDAEPRLLGSILVPGRTYRGIQLDIRRGVIDESVDPSDKIAKFVPDDYSSTTSYSNNSWFSANVKSTTRTVFDQETYETSTGAQLKLIGMDGPKTKTNNTITGLHGRKWLDLSLPVSEVKLHSSFQSWIDIRLAEVILNRAEAALELYQNGVTTLDGVDLREDAFNQMNRIRARAGATLLADVSELNNLSAHTRGGGPGGFVQAPNRGLQLIRIERYKELAFEHKIYWDLKRWFTFHDQINNYRRRMISPFLFAKGATVNSHGNPEGKLIFDVRVAEKAAGDISFQTKYYYQQIPNNQIKTNPLLEQNDQW